MKKSDYLVGDYSADDLTRSGAVEKLAAHKEELTQQAEAIFDLARSQKRELNLVEAAEVDRIIDQARDVRARIVQANEARTRISTISSRYDDSNACFTPEWRALREGRQVRIDLPIHEILAKYNNRTKVHEQIDIRGLATSTVSSVPTTIYPELIQRLINQSGVLASNVKTYETGESGNPVKVPTQSSYSTATFVSEGSALSESYGNYSSVTLNAYKTGTLFAVSNELVTDTSFDIVPYFAENLSNAISTSVGSKLISGSGTAEPQGILTGASVGVTGTATAPSIANILSLWASLPVGYRPGASWVMHPATYANLVGLNDTTGRSLVLSDLSSSQPTTLMGQPVYLDTNMPTAGTANASVFVGDLSRYMIVRYAGGVRLDQSVDYKFNTDELTWRVLMRFDSKVVNSDAARVFVGA